MNAKELGERLGTALGRTVGFDLVGGELGRDLRAALRSALDQGAVFRGASTPLTIFRQSVQEAIGDIHKDGRAELFLRFLKEGPYEREGEIAPEMVGKRLTTEETATVITFIYSHMVNCFKGALAEMLATAPCLRVLRQLQKEGRAPRQTRLYVGDAVWAPRPKGGAFGKAADLHMLVENLGPRSTVSVLGLAEVKSYFCRPTALGRQLDKHLARAMRGLRVEGRSYPPGQIEVGSAGDGRAARITVAPARWALPRTFRFEERRGSRFLHVEPGTPPEPADSVARTGDMEWRVVLRWSKEALDEAAYGMTFWYMEKVGEALYSDGGVPDEWKEMTPAQAGCNAAEMVLYYAIRPFVLKEQNGKLTAQENLQKQRAIALYNSYGFGYALGMNFRNQQGKREMLWPKDLDEILAKGRTRRGFRIA